MYENHSKPVVKKKIIEFAIRTDILPASGFTIDEIKDTLSNLTSIFGKDYLTLFPSNINDNLTLETLMRLSSNLNALKDCEGFKNHIKGYKSSPKHTQFLTEIAAFIIPKVDKLVLEPHIPNKLKHPDILFESKGEIYYIECKSPEPDQFNYSKEHKHFFNMIKAHISVPHQIDIKYKIILDDSQIKELGKSLEEMLPRVTADGVIIHNDNLEVNVIIKEKYGPPTISLVLDMIEQDLHDNHFYPANAYMIGGKSLVIAGPLVNFSKILKKKIMVSRKQSAYKKPYILAIDSSMFLGDMKENMRIIQTSFQPEQNTRFSGVLLIKTENTIQDFKLKFNFISNPYTKNPLPKHIVNIFKS